MKGIITIIASLFIISTNAQNFYDESGSKKKSAGDETLITFQDGIDNKQDDGTSTSATVATDLIPAAIDLVWKIGTSALEKREAKFADEFEKTKTYSDISKNDIPGFTLERNFMLNGAKKTALKIKFEPKIVDPNTYVYNITEFKCDFSGAKVASKTPYNDYAIEVKLYYFDKEGKKQEQTLKPINLELVKVGTSHTLKDTDGNYIYSTDKFVTGSKFIFSEVSVKVVETNAAKVKADKVKQIVSDYKEDAKKVIDIVVKAALPSEDSQDDKKDDDDEGEEKDK